MQQLNQQLRSATSSAVETVAKVAFNSAIVADKAASEADKASILVAFSPIAVALAAIEA